MDFQDHVLDYEEPSPIEASTKSGLPIPNQVEKDINSDLIALYVSELQWYTSDQDIESLITAAGLADKFLPLELTFKEDKVNGKSNCEAFLKFTTHDAAAAAKSFLEQSTSFKISFANLATKPNPFRETPTDSKQNESQQKNKNFQHAYDQRYYEHAYMARFYQQSGRDQRARYQSFQTGPYHHDSRGHYHDSNRRRRSREGDRRNSNENRDSRDFRKY